MHTARWKDWGDGFVVRVGMASVAAGVAVLTVIVGLCAWAVHGSEPAEASSAGTQSELSATTAAPRSFDERFSPGRSAPRFGSVTVKTVIAALPITAAIAVPAAPAPNVATQSPGPGATTGVLEPRAATRSVVTSPQDAALSNSVSGDTRHTAIYDISARKVYLPNGERLEAHSGLGDYIDDVRFVL